MKYYEQLDYTPVMMNVIMFRWSCSKLLKCKFFQKMSDGYGAGEILRILPLYFNSLFVVEQNPLDFCQQSSINSSFSILKKNNILFYIYIFLTLFRFERYNSSTCKVLTHKFFAFGFLEQRLKLFHINISISDMHIQCFYFLAAGDYF